MVEKRRLVSTQFTATPEGEAASLLKALRGGGPLRCTITQDQVLHRAVRRSAERFQSNEDTQETAATTSALNTFIDRLSGLEAVDAVAFLVSSVPDCPTTLTIEVLTPITMKKSSIDTCSAVNIAKADLSKGLDSVMPSGLRYINTKNTANVQSLEPKLRERWRRDGLQEIAFLVFQRN